MEFSLSLSLSFSLFSLSLSLSFSISLFLCANSILFDIPVRRFKCSPCRTAVKMRPMNNGTPHQLRAMDALKVPHTRAHSASMKSEDDRLRQVPYLSPKSLNSASKVASSSPSLVMEKRLFSRAFLIHQLAMWTMLALSIQTLKNPNWDSDHRWSKDEAS